jgi:hypothetical protein
MTSVTRKPSGQAREVLDRVELALVVDPDRAGNGEGQIGLARHFRDDAGVPHR